MRAPTTYSNTHQLLIVLFASIFMTSCSTLSLTYRYADWLLYWKIDHYVDITLEQKPLLTNQLATLQRWHKTRELPRYAHFLEDSKNKWADGFTQQEVETIFRTCQFLWKRLGHSLATRSVRFLKSLNADQIHGLQQTLQDENREILEQLSGDRNILMDNRVERVLDRLENWVGRLTQNQKIHIDRLIRNIPDTSRAWFNNRVRRQVLFIGLLRKQTNGPNLEHDLHDLLTSPEKGASQTYVSAIQQQETVLIHTIVEIDRILTPDQRKHAIHQIENLLEEFKKMSQD